MRLKRDADTPLNPSFPLRFADAKNALKRMTTQPVSLRRPLVILGGYLDPYFAAAHLKRQFQRITGDLRLVATPFFFRSRFGACRRKVINEVDRAFPSDDPRWTTAVDVVAFSMGGLIARHAAARDTTRAAQRRLRIERLFTISTPHLGARMAALPSLTDLQRDMRIGSAFLRDLISAAEEAPHTLYPYVRLRDRVIGEENAAPEGVMPWWVAAPPLSLSHAMAFRDPRIIADIARRLRDEEPFTRDPPAPLPSGRGRLSAAQRE